MIHSYRIIILGLVIVGTETPFNFVQCAALQSIKVVCCCSRFKNIYDCYCLVDSGTVYEELNTNTKRNLVLVCFVDVNKKNLIH